MMGSTSGCGDKDEKEKIEKMQISKKIYTTLIIAILTISVIITAIPIVSAEITADPILSVTNGPVGTEVNVSGLAGAASPFSTVTVYWNSLSGQVLGSGDADNTGAYSIDVEIPPAVFGTHFIVVNDGETESAGTAFDVEARLIANTIPATPGTPQVLPGDSITLTGDGFAASDAITVYFNSTILGTPNSFVIALPAITSDANGSFEATITIPATVVLAEFDTYDCNARDEDLNVATDQVTIDYYIMCTPSAGPTGITTTISGRIAPATAYTLRFNGAVIASGTTAADGSYSATYTIPGVLSVGPYTVDIVWETTNTRDTTFTINPSPTIALGAASGMVGEEIGITGSGFSSLAEITLSFGTTVVNDTAGGFGPTTGPTPGPAGNIPAGSTFIVPALTPGIYAVSVVDEYGAASATGVFFTIDVTPVISVMLRGDMYYQGDRPSFSIVSTDTFTAGPVVTIRDPSGNVWWTEDWNSVVVAVGPVQTVPYEHQFFVTGEHAEFPADAPLGAWNWTITYTTTVLGSGSDTGLFTLEAPATLDDLVSDVADLEDTVNDGVDDILDSIDDNCGTITSIVTASAGDIAMIMTDVGQIETLVSGLEITAITNDLTIIKSDLGTLLMDVAALDATVSAIEGDVATVDTALGTLQGTVTAIEGNTATIETDVGTLQADVTDVKGSVDQTPAWIAVVLSLVAAIAAIFAVITIRQKIAG
jgi:hypothetical protein